MSGVTEISKNRFDALQFLREKNTEAMFEEVAWFEAFDRKILAAIARFRDDKDYGIVLFARDERQVFRFHRIVKQTFLTQKKAYSALMVTLEIYQFDGKKVYEESPFKAKEINLFQPVVKPEKFHPFFQVLRESQVFEAARGILSEMALHFSDSDGNFIKDFQTTEFHSRLWELFLHILFSKRFFKINRTYKSPDFCLNFYGEIISVEAVTVNANPDFDEPYPETELDKLILARDYMPIKFGKCLMRKLEKHGSNYYWELAHVKGNPLLLAVHDYHAPGGNGKLGSMTWSRDALPDYLYGHRIKYFFNDSQEIVFETQIIKGEIVPVYEKITSHHWKGKGVPPGFFFQPNAENISAVIFANNATLSTFNRMGKLAGFGGKNLKITRVTAKVDHLTGLAKEAISDVDDPAYEEDWGNGVAIYHNPNALTPLDPALFPDLTHFMWNQEASQIQALLAPNYTIFSSQLDTYFTEGAEATQPPDVL